MTTSSTIDSILKLPSEIQNEIASYKHRTQMKNVFREMLYVKCEYCKRYVKKSWAVYGEVVFLDFVYCSDSCYSQHNYQYTQFCRGMGFY
jgi:hypothetical protein